VDKAKASPGVVAVLTAADIPGVNDSGYYFGPPDSVPDYVLVPEGQSVAFHSQPVALVLADSPSAAQRAARLVEVAFDGFSVPVVTIDDARDGGHFMGIRDEVTRGEASAVLESVSYTAISTSIPLPRMLRCDAAPAGEAGQADRLGGERRGAVRGTEALLHGAPDGNAWLCRAHPTPSFLALMTLFVNRRTPCRTRTA
jgi:hypothetical protein